MNRFVLDCSITMSWCFEDESQSATDGVLNRFLLDQAVVPVIWPLEVANVLLVGERKGRLTPEKSTYFMAMLETLPIIVDQPPSALSLNNIYSLARTYQLSAYDASYLELAMREGIALATLDKSLCTAAKHAGINLLGQESS